MGTITFALFINLVTDNCANSCTTDCSRRTATGQNGATDSPDSRACRGVFVLLGHARTTGQTQ